MRNVKDRLESLAATPKREIPGKVARFARRRALRVVGRVEAAISGTYARPRAAPGFAPGLPRGGMESDRLRQFPDAILASAQAALAHWFDLLGSGPVVVRHGIGCAGVEGHKYPPGVPVDADREGRWLSGRINRSNLGESRRIWALLDDGYLPIDWHLDFKSGYRWSESEWFARDDSYPPGADIKVPWELARMQHLPVLAWAHALAGAGAAGFGRPEVYAREFRNQTLDFIATNPPCFGVNWRCTMDVGIRAANMVVARDLFAALGADFDADFDAAFARSLFEHGRHIVANLEWDRRLRSNHYLANIAGLVFASSALGRSPETDAWLAFAVRELVTEVAEQFNADGSNFEASTSYHRLSAEMVLFSTARILGLSPDRLDALRGYDHRVVKGDPGLRPAPTPMHRIEGMAGPVPFPPWYIERLEKMVEFTLRITAPDGTVPQIGDNDSGRFFKLTPSRTGDTDHRHLLSTASALFDREDLAVHSALFRPDVLLAGLYAGRRRLPVGPRRDSPHVSGTGARLTAFPDFGLFVYGTDRLFLAVRCGRVGQKGLGGHAHNDQLSISLWVDGIPILVDPGTYLYTPDIGRRNLFRSTAMHNTLCVEGREQNPWIKGAPGVFTLRETARAVVERLENCRLVGLHDGFGVPHRREIEIADSRVRGVDVCGTATGKTVAFHCAPGVRVERTDQSDTVRLVAQNVALLLSGGPGVWRVGGYDYSAGYGMITPSCACVELRGDASRLEWMFAVDMGRTQLRRP